MPTPSDALSEYLAARLAEAPAGALCVAFSGGGDSVALLHALGGLPAARARGLRAVHVDHGLHPASVAWAEQCQRQCQAWSIPFEALRVAVVRDGQGPEAAARQARYAALAERLGAQDILLLAQHRDDQAETVLLKLLRGAGPEGLGGMRAWRALGRARLWRPLLELPRETLRAYRLAHGLDCIEDPSNADPALARNRLRHDILPRLLAPWPHALDAILHSARLSREAADALEAQWRAALTELCDDVDGSLHAAGWLALPSALRHPLLDHWLHRHGCSAPTARQRAQIEHQLGARSDRVPCIHWSGTELHVWKGRLWARPPRDPPPASWEALWHGEPLQLPDGGELRLEPTARLAEPLRVQLRRGGERIRPAGDRHTRELRDLFQQAAWPPWQRSACPLLYRDDRLLAVADRWLSAEAQDLFERTGSRPVWQPPDSMRTNGARQRGDIVDRELRDLDAD